MSTGMSAGLKLFRFISSISIIIQYTYIHIVRVKFPDKHLNVQVPKHFENFLGMQL